PNAITGHRHRAGRTSVVAAAQGQYFVAATRVGGQQQRCLVGLGPGIGEEHLRVRDFREPGDLLGQLHLATDQVEGGGVHDPLGELLLDRRTDLGHVVAEHVGRDAGEEVQIGVSFGVDYARALAADDLQGRVVVEGHPGRHDRAVAREEFRHATQSRPEPGPLARTNLWTVCGTNLRCAGSLRPGVFRARVTESDSFGGFFCSSGAYLSIPVHITSCALGSISITWSGAGAAVRSLQDDEQISLGRFGVGVPPGAHPDLLVSRSARTGAASLRWKSPADHSALRSLLAYLRACLRREAVHTHALRA